MTSLQLGIGSAAYKMGDYELASKAYGVALIRSSKCVREQAHYNLGNTLFRKGELTLNPSDHTNPGGLAAMEATSDQIIATLRQWIGALEHYQAALKLNHKNSDAAFNIDVLKNRIAMLKGVEPKEFEDDQKPQDGQDGKNKDGKDKNKSKPKEREGDKGDGENGEDSPSDKNDSNDQGNEDGEPDEPNDDNQDSNDDSEDSDEPLEGELTAADDGAERRSEQKRETETNPETGYSKTRARQVLGDLANEDGKLRMALPQPFSTEKYKNW